MQFYVLFSYWDLSCLVAARALMIWFPPTNLSKYLRQLRPDVGLGKIQSLVKNLRVHGGLVNNAGNPQQVPMRKTVSRIIANNQYPLVH